MKVTKNNAALPKVLEEYVINMTEKDTDELRVLVYVLSREEETDTAEMAEALGIEETEAVSAVSFWRGMGIIQVSGRVRGKKQGSKKTQMPGEQAATNDAEKKSKSIPNSVRDTDTRSYTGEEIAALLERSEVNSLHDYAQRRLGKTFSHSDSECLARLLDYVLLTPEMVMLIVEYCVENGKNSMRYVEKTAISIYDEGIRDYEALVTYFEKKKAAKSNEGTVKRIMGINDRSFTSKEKEHISRWFEDFGFGEEMISLAYERTIANISKPSIPYMSKLLELWHGKGFKNALDVENERKDSTSAGAINLESFDEASKPGAVNNSQDGLDLEDFFENP